MAKAKRKTKRKAKRKVPAASRKTTVMTTAIRDAMMKVHQNTKKAEQARAEAELKVFAARLIAHIMKEAGIKGPSWSVKKKLAAKARKKASLAKKRAIKKADIAKRQARRKVAAAQRKVAASKKKRR